MKTKIAYKRVMEKKNDSGMVLVVVLCLTVVGGILAAGLITATTSQIKSVRRYSKQEQAFYIAESGIECAASVLDETNDLDSVLANGMSCFASPVSFAGGTFKITVTDNNDGDGNLLADSDDTVIVRSTGTFENVTRVIETTMTIPDFDLIPPIVDAPLAYYGSNCTLTLTGSGGKIVGNDYEVPENFICSGANCWGDIATPQTSTACSVYSETALTVDGLTKIEAEPPPRLQTGGGILTGSNWLEVVNQLIPLADITITGTVNYAGNTCPIGTRTEPKITVVRSNGVMNVSGTVDGAGVLILQDGAQLVMGGNYHYEGLIIALGNAATEISGHGTPMISGAVVCLGQGLGVSLEGSDLDLTGSGGIRYSSAALANLSNLGANTNVIFVVSWREVK